MNQFRKYTLGIIFILMFSFQLRAQDSYRYVQANVYAGYEWISESFTHSAYSVDLNVDYHFHKTFYASVLGYVTNYNGEKSSNNPSYANAEILNDDIGAWMVGIGPGADIISNRYDRIYTSLYVGYGKINRNYEGFDSNGLVASLEAYHAGVGCMLQLGYEHCFDSGFVLGGSAHGMYLVNSFNWGIGLRIGFRL